MSARRRTPAHRIQRRRNARGSRPIVRWFLAILAVVDLGIAVRAYAHMTATGSGTSSAPTGTVSVTMVTPGVGDVPSGTLIPGASADVNIRVRNTTSAALEVIDVAAAGSVTADLGGCTVSDVTFVAPLLLQGDPANIVAAGTERVITLPLAAQMGTSSSNGCQGAVFTIPVTVTVRT